MSISVFLMEIDDDLQKIQQHIEHESAHIAASIRCVRDLVQLLSVQVSHSDKIEVAADPQRHFEKDYQSTNRPMRTDRALLLLTSKLVLGLCTKSQRAGWLAPDQIDELKRLIAALEAMQ